MRRFAFLLFTLLGLSSLHADDWPRFRGPHGWGISEDKNIPTEITEANYKWTAPLPGDGVSSPAIIGDKIFMTAMGKKDGERHILALDAKSGKVLWQKDYKFEPHKKHRYNSFAASTPACDSERVYVSWADPDGREVIALTHDGKEVWSKTIDRSYYAQHGSSASPVLSEGVLVITNEKDEKGAFLAGLDPTTGKEKWKIKRDHEGKAPYNTPVEFLPADSPPLLLCLSSAEGITAVNPATGKVAWKFDCGFSLRVVGSAGVTGETIFAQSGNGGGARAGVAVVSKGGAAPDLAWEMNKRIPYVPTILGYKDHFYMLKDNGTLNCVRASDGEVLWDERATGEAYASPVCINGYLYCLGRRGDLVVAKTGPKFEIVSKHNFDGPVDASPAVANGHLYVRVGDKLICIGK